MITTVELARFAEKCGWIIVDQAKNELDNYIQYLTPSGQKVLVRFNEDGSIDRI